MLPNVERNSTPSYLPKYQEALSLKGYRVPPNQQTSTTTITLFSSAIEAILGLFFCLLAYVEKLWNLCMPPV